MKHTAERAHAILSTAMCVLAAILMCYKFQVEFVSLRMRKLMVNDVINNNSDWSITRVYLYNIAQTYLTANSP